MIVSDSSSFDDAIITVLTETKKKTLTILCVYNENENSLGANELGYPDTVHGLFIDPGAELALYFYSLSNDSLSRLLKDGTLTCTKEK